MTESREKHVIVNVIVKRIDSTESTDDEKGPATRQVMLMADAYAMCVIKVDET